MTENNLSLCFHSEGDGSDAEENNTFSAHVEWLKEELRPNIPVLTLMQLKKCCWLWANMAHWESDCLWDGWDKETSGCAAWFYGHSRKKRCFSVAVLHNKSVLKVQNCSYNNQPASQLVYWPVRQPLVHQWAVSQSSAQWPSHPYSQRGAGQVELNTPLLALSWTEAEPTPTTHTSSTRTHKNTHTHSGQRGHHCHYLPSAGLSGLRLEGEEPRKRGGEAGGERMLVLSIVCVCVG